MAVAASDRRKGTETNTVHLNLPLTGKAVRASTVPADTAASFPLRARFQRWILPGLAAFSILLVGAVAFGTYGAIQEVYLDLAQRRSATLASAIDGAASTEWHALLSSRSPAELYDTPQGRKLARTIKEETREIKAGRVKIFAGDGRVLYAARPESIGTIGQAGPVREVYASRHAVLVEGRDDYGVEFYRLFVPLLGHDGAPEAVVEFDEPSGYLDRVIWRNILAPVAIPALLLISMIAALLLLVRRAQQHIDARTAALVALRRQLESFVSRGTVAAADTAPGPKAKMGTRIVATLLYADVREFSSYAEHSSLEHVVQFLNSVTDVITSTVRQHGGDIDKLMGDGALARFEGPQRKLQAVIAAQEILRRLAALALPRGLGIGIYDGEVIAAVIGSHERKDYTVLGDGVNVASRLCDLAAEGEIVAAVGVLQALPDKVAEFGPLEEVPVKGRTSRIEVRRWSL